MSATIEKDESSEDAALRRWKEKVTFLVFTVAATAGLAVSLAFIVFDDSVESQRLSWPAFTGILGLIIGRQTKK